MAWIARGGSIVVAAYPLLLIGLRFYESIGDHAPLHPVEFHILLSVAAGERHGYGILQDIQERGDAPRGLEVSWKKKGRPLQLASAG